VSFFVLRFFLTFGARSTPAKTRERGRAYERATCFAEAKAICAKAIAEKVDSSWTHQQLYRIAFVEGDESTMQREIDWFKGKPQETSILYYRAKAALSLGRFAGPENFSNAPGHSPCSKDARRRRSA
jgi:hypothetical protein